MQRLQRVHDAINSAWAHSCLSVGFKVRFHQWRLKPKPDSAWVKWYLAGAGAPQQKPTTAQFLWASAHTQTLLSAATHWSWTREMESFWGSLCCSLTPGVNVSCFSATTFNFSSVYCSLQMKYMHLKVKTGYLLLHFVKKMHTWARCVCAGCFNTSKQTIYNL